MQATSTPLTIGPQLAPPMPIARVFRAYASEMKYESLRMLRTPGFSIPFLVLPVPIYLFFGVALAGPAIAENPALANYLFASWLVFAAMGPGLFGVGCALALERDAGLLKLKRASPAPGGCYLAAKMAMAMGLSTLAIVSIVVVALVVGKISLSPIQLLIMTTVMIAGTVPLSAIGLFIGAHTSGSAAPAITNVVFMPMLWLSGLFFPLPKFLEPWVVIWPAFHLNQVALGAAGINEFSFVAPQISAAVLAGITVLFGGAAIYRLARTG
jgi:ABC-2 type transport system permease protein